MYHEVMKLSAALLIFSAIAPLSAQTSAQTTTPHPARPAGTAARPAAAAACVKLPEMSEKIPALPAGAPCAKHLYTITTTPNVKLEYISPLETPTLKEDLGIETTSFSLDYVDTKVGTGELAGAKKWYTIDYTGYLLNGTIFDSSKGKKPITIPYGGHRVIPGWDTGFAGMRVGGKRRLIIPFQLAYGANSPQGSGIPPRSMLVFDVELLKISDEEPKPEPPPAPPAKPAAPAPPAGTPGTPPPAAPPAAEPTKPAATPPASAATPPKG
jgi:peptidylprolyl isomerase